MHKQLESDREREGAFKFGYEIVPGLWVCPTSVICAPLSSILFEDIGAIEVVIIILMILNIFSLQPLAPPLNDNLQYHVFFLCHHSDHNWTLNVIDKLQAPPLGFHCYCHDRDLDLNGSLHSSTHLGMKNSQKTVMVLTPDFITDVWCHADLQLLSEMDVLLIQKDLILLLVQVSTWSMFCVMFSA